MEMDVGELKPFCSSYFDYYPPAPPVLFVDDLSPVLMDGFLLGDKFYCCMLPFLVGD